MNKSLSLTAKLVVFIVLALIFCATMIALSTHRPTLLNRDDNHYAWGNDRQMDRTFSVQPGGTLVVDADQGSFNIVGTESSDVHINVTARGSEEILQKYDIKFRQDGNTVKVEARLKHRFFNFFHFGNYNLDVHFEVSVPKNFNLNVQTAGGDIVVDDVKGTIDGETSGGDLELSNLDGNVKVSTSGGNVELRNAVGDISLETSGGDIRGESIIGSMRVETSGGNIELRDSDGKLIASTSGGDIRVTMKDNKGIDLSTSGGNLYVRLPKSIAADVKAETTGGDVSCDFQFEGKMKEGSMKGKINGGGNLINLETTGGDIIISTLE